MSSLTAYDSRFKPTTDAKARRSAGTHLSVSITTCRPLKGRRSKAWMETAALLVNKILKDNEAEFLKALDTVAYPAFKISYNENAVPVLQAIPREKFFKPDFAASECRAMDRYLIHKEAR